MNDFRFALRTLLRNPSFTLAAILALALGIGATTAIFSVVDAVLLKPLPYPQPDQLVSVAMRFSGPGADGFLYFIPSWDYLDWSRDNKVFESYAAMGRIRAGASHSSQRASQRHGSPRLDQSARRARSLARPGPPLPSQRRTHGHLPDPLSFPTLSGKPPSPPTPKSWKNPSSSTEVSAKSPAFFLPISSSP